ncbi:hypothetical protein EB796_006705 [Bugula neritina]|uniref:RING-type domain-containing protein n=1 Tax=Bugula neritina TaxID=10212 RepID=A0A7J7K9S9_BUGNE|nr:hypothetical protein EB796_006705 [Bugula neritina]
MASNSRAKSARTRAIDAFQLTVECGICTNVSQLRLLPCQHMMCAPCLGTILKSSNKCCPFCKERLTEYSAQSYPVCRITSDLQRDIQQLADALKD